MEKNGGCKQVGVVRCTAVGGDDRTVVNNQIAPRYLCQGRGGDGADARPHGLECSGVYLAEGVARPREVAIETCVAVGESATGIECPVVIHDLADVVGPADAETLGFARHDLTRGAANA